MNMHKALILILCIIPLILGFSSNNRLDVSISPDDGKYIQTYYSENGALVELPSGTYSLVLTQEKGSESFAKLISNKGVVLEHITIDKNSEKTGKTVHIGGKSWYTIQAGGSPSAKVKIVKGRYSDISESNQRPIIVDGVGSRILGPFRLDKGYYGVSYTHKGESNFIIKVVASSELKDVLVNEIGFTYGEVGLIMDEAADCFFEITADGSWNLSTSIK